MTSVVPPADGVARFIADLADEGHEPARCGDVVRYRVIPASGRYAGVQLETGVSVCELQGWPTVPPHWIHLPDEVGFAHTNVDVQNCLPGWQRHSRDTGPWRMDRKPILVWIAHVRGVLGQAI
ncbi:hypothetical protein [Rhodococcus aetherivorans]|uniref:hypothetical protein n=1 Tax=Rhodococcus aetherivorans TaxID=191292 RepID=UPI00163A8A64|nr:hypothetical protein [Rhodococcus aetherivorans]MBC2586915.1 hypothetical protein [Rhodococcus aetherivorans]